MLNKLSDNVRKVSNSYRSSYHTIYSVNVKQAVRQCQKSVKQLQVVYHTIYSVNVKQAVRQCQKSVKQLQK